MTTVERRVDVLDEVITKETELAASRDRDLADMQVTLRSHTAMLQALHERQAEHSTLLNMHSKQLTELRVGQQTIVGMLKTLIDRE